MSTLSSILSIFVMLMMIAVPLYFVWRITAVFVIKKYLVFENNPELEDQQSFFTHVLPKANEAILGVRGSQGEKGGTFIKAIVNSPEDKVRGKIFPGCPVENFDLVVRKKFKDGKEVTTRKDSNGKTIMEIKDSGGKVVTLSDDAEIMPEADEMGPFEKYVFDKTGLRYKGINFWDIFFSALYRYRLLYTKEETVVEQTKSGTREVARLIPRNAMSHRFLLGEQTHYFEVKDIDVGGIERKRTTVDLKGHVTFRIVNLYKPTQIAGQYVVKVRDQVINLARNIVQQRRVDELLLGVEEVEEEAKDAQAAVSTAKDDAQPQDPKAENEASTQQSARKKEELKAKRKRFLDDIGSTLTAVNNCMVGVKVPQGVDPSTITDQGTEALWGIQIIRVTVEELIFPEEVLKILRQQLVETEQGKAYAIGKILRAKADKDARTLQGEGEEAYRTSLGKGDAGAIKMLKETARVSQVNAEALVLNRQKTEAIVASRAATVVMDTKTKGLMLNVDTEGDSKQGKEEVA